MLAPLVPTRRRTISMAASVLVLSALVTTFPASLASADSGGAGVSSADPSGETMPVGNLPGWRQVFTDNFTTDVPLGSFPAAVSAKWGAYGSPAQDTRRHATYSPKKVVSIDNGVLNKYIHTENKVSMVAALLPKVPGSSRNGQLYGRYAVRYKMDRIEGYKVAWLLWPDSGIWPRDGEIDFPERDLIDPEVKGFVHRQDATLGSDQGWAKATHDLSKWHTAVIEWSPNSVVFILDGVELKRFTERIPNTPMHWVIQTESTLTRARPPVSAKGNVQIDWVAAWQYDPKAVVAPPPPVDTTGPTAMMTSPISDSTVTGIIPITADANDPVGVAETKWYVDGLEAGRATNAPWASSFDTSALASGDHTMFVKARDTLGNWSTSGAITFKIAAPPDLTGPVVSPTAPLTTTVWNGTVTLAASASDPAGVTAVKWYINGHEVAYEGHGSPWVDDFDTTTISNGEHNLLVKARDGFGNWGTSQSRTITVSN